MTPQQLKVAKQAYAAVFGVSVADAGKGEHKQRIASALEEVIGYPNLLPGETEDGRNERLDMDNPAVADVAFYISTLDPTKYESLNSWETVFTMLKSIDEHEDAGVVEEVSGTVTNTIEEKEANTSESSSEESETSEDNTQMNEAAEAVSSENKNISKEDSKMAKNVLEEEVNNMKQAGADALFGDNKGGVLPEGPDQQAALDAFQEAYNATKDQRIAVSRNARISQVILAKPNNKEVYVEGEAAMGTVADIAEAEDKFMTQTGCKVDPETGNVTFDLVPPSQLDNAKEMYDLIQKVKADPETKIAVGTSDSIGTLRGFRYVSPDNKSELKDKKEIEDILFYDAWNVLIIDKEAGLQLYLTSAKKKNNTAEGRGNGAERDSKNPYAGITTLGISDRKTACSKFGVYVKQVMKDKPTIVKSGAKSKLSVKFYKPGKFKKNSTTELQQGTFKLNLKVEQYKLECTDQDLKDKFDSATTSYTPVDVDTLDASAKATEAMTEIIMAMYNNNLIKADSALGKAVDKIEAIEAEAREKEAGDIGDVEI